MTSVPVALAAAAPPNARGEAPRHPAAAAAHGDQFLQLRRPAGRLRDDAAHRRGVPPLQLQARAPRLGESVRVRRRLVGLRPDRRPRRPAQGDLHGHPGLVDRHHRLGAVDLLPDAAVFSRAGRGGRRGLRAVGQHAPLRGRAARKARAGARHLQRRHGARRDERPRAGGDAGAPPRLARRLLDRGRSVDPARALLGVSSPPPSAWSGRRRRAPAPSCSRRPTCWRSPAASWPPSAPAR